MTLYTASASSSATPYVTRLPSGGDLFMVSDGVQGARITMVPAAVPSGTVLYVPTMGTTSDGLAYVAMVERYRVQCSCQLL